MHVTLCSLIEHQLRLYICEIYPGLMKAGVFVHTKRDKLIDTHTVLLLSSGNSSGPGSWISLLF